MLSIGKLVQEHFRGTVEEWGLHREMLYFRVSARYSYIAATPVTPVNEVGEIAKMVDLQYTTVSHSAILPYSLFLQEGAKGVATVLQTGLDRAFEKQQQFNPYPWLTEVILKFSADNPDWPVTVDLIKWVAGREHGIELTQREAELTLWEVQDAQSRAKGR